jgi:hypothetical protein
MANQFLRNAFISYNGNGKADSYHILALVVIDSGGDNGTAIPGIFFLYLFDNGLVQ